MSPQPGVVLHVDGDRWRAHLRSAAAAEPLLVPVAKGNGYGFGNHRLARRAEWLGADTIAVGTYAEIVDVAQRFDGDILVLAPWRPGPPASVSQSSTRRPVVEERAPASVSNPTAAGTRTDRIIHTVGRLEDLQALADVPGRPRVVLERLTSMKRHGFTARGLRAAAGLLDGVRVDGASLHLPLERHSGANLAEVEELMTDIVAAGIAPRVVWVSHLEPADLASIRVRFPDYVFRPRVGTALWLGDRSALRVTATVLDVHPVERGERFGYRGRATQRSGTLLVVAGGTANGIGLEAPTGAGGVRARAGSLLRGGLDAVGAVRSPYTVSGKQRFFAEPPHMQASMLFLPSDAEIPAIGDQVELRVRFTATTFDEVEIS